jgi:hypothetical protein
MNRLDYAVERFSMKVAENHAVPLVDSEALEAAGSSMRPLFEDSKILSVSRHGEWRAWACDLSWS